MSVVEIPANVASQEELGRMISSSKSAARARRSRLPFTEFLPPPGRIDISVDRLSIAPADEALANADGSAAARGRTFYGWAVVTAQSARGNKRRVVASPIPDTNPYHADIILPEHVTGDREEHKRHAQELADLSRWYDRIDLRQGGSQHAE